MRQTILLALILLFSINLQATETKIMVRAKAKDAKFIGSSLGGAYVIIKNKVNQQILAQGLTAGGTGNTNLIMKTAKTRNMQISDDQTAGFLANIDISEPTFVSIEVLSPSQHKQAQAKVSTELWLIPGKDILGDGIILEIPGFIIDVLKPRTHQYIKLQNLKTEKLEVQANIVMMCGCVIDKGGIWDSEQMEVKAILKKDGKLIGEVNLALVSANLFEGVVDIQSAGNYEITVYAYDPKTGNTGVDKVNYVIFE